MNTKIAGVLIVAVSLAGCTHEDDTAARRKLENAGHELKHETEDAGRKLKKGLHEAGQELKKDANEASHEIKKGSEKLKDDLHSK